MSVPGITAPEIAAYEAPFPTRKSKAGARILPSLVPLGENEAVPDPRAKVIKATADKVFEITGRSPLLDVALELERIALQFRGEPSPSETDDDPVPSNRLFQDQETTQKSMEEATEENRLTNVEPIVDTEIETQSRILEKNLGDGSACGSLPCSETASKAVRETAAALDLDPEYLLDKSVQAVLRMIQRNKNRVTFPLEVKQVDSID